jgi:hypothetical protein
MVSLCGSVIRIPAIALFLLLIMPQKTNCQDPILDSLFTFREGLIKTGSALNIITSRTGFNFSYDSRLIDEEKETEMRFENEILRVILKNILKNDSLVFSVIDKYIIISRSVTTGSSPPLSAPEYITGTIIDEETLDPLPYATLGLKNSGRGTITNNNGEFGLKIPGKLSDDTLSVSYLGYIRQEIPLNEITDYKLTISMKREFISIPEIIIRNQIPQEIINKARMAIPENYGSTPAYMTAFYREGVLRRNKLQNYSEAVLQIYKSSYSGTLLGDQVKIYKSRKTENSDITDTLTVRLKAGLSTCLELDGVKNLFDFLERESMSDYSYRLTDIVTYDEESAFAIEFEQADKIDEPLYKGTVYINTADYGILHAEFELNQSLIHKMKGSFITNSTRGFNTWPLSAKYSVSYRKTKDRYFLSHVRGDLLFSSRQKKKLFNTQFTVFLELAITETRLDNVVRFDREERAPVHSIFSKTITDYDPLFWEDQDFIRPEENLLQALKNMNVRLHEFSEQSP